MKVRKNLPCFFVLKLVCLGAVFVGSHVVQVRYRFAIDLHTHIGRRKKHILSTFGDVEECEHLKYQEAVNGWFAWVSVKRSCVELCKEAKDLSTLRENLANNTRAMNGVVRALSDMFDKFHGAQTQSALVHLSRKSCLDVIESSDHSSPIYNDLAVCLYLLWVFVLYYYTDEASGVLFDTAFRLWAISQNQLSAVFGAAFALICNSEMKVLSKSWIARIFDWQSYPRSKFVFVLLVIFSHNYVIVNDSVDWILDSLIHGYVTAYSAWGTARKVLESTKKSTADAKSPIDS